MFVQLQAARPLSPQPCPAAAPDAVAIERARLVDMAQVGPLINSFAMRGLMLPKTPEQLCRTFREFIVARSERERVVGCAALRVYSPGLAELSGLAVAPQAGGRGVGRRLVDAILEEARSLGIGTVFALTLEEAFFHRLGFKTVPREAFPQKVSADCAACDRRNGCREITVAREVDGKAALA